MRICAVIRDLEVDMVEQDFMNEKRSAAREYEEQKVYLRDQLIHELEEKQRMIVSSKRFLNQIWWLHTEEKVVQCMRVAQCDCIRRQHFLAIHLVLLFLF